MCSTWFASVLAATSVASAPGDPERRSLSADLDRGARNDRRIVEDLHRPREQDLGVELIAPVRRDEIVEVDRERLVVDAPPLAVARREVLVAQGRVEARVVHEEVEARHLVGSRLHQIGRVCGDLGREQVRAVRRQVVREERAQHRAHTSDGQVVAHDFSPERRRNSLKLTRGWGALLLGGGGAARTSMWPIEIVTSGAGPTEPCRDGVRATEPGAETERLAGAVGRATIGSGPACAPSGRRDGEVSGDAWPWAGPRDGRRAHRSRVERGCRPAPKPEARRAS